MAARIIHDPLEEGALRTGYPLPDLEKGLMLSLGTFTDGTIIEEDGLYYGVEVERNAPWFLKYAKKQKLVLVEQTEGLPLFRSE